MDGEKFLDIVNRIGKRQNGFCDESWFCQVKALAFSCKVGESSPSASRETIKASMSEGRKTDFSGFHLKAPNANSEDERLRSHVSSCISDKILLVQIFENIWASDKDQV